MAERGSLDILSIGLLSAQWGPWLLQLLLTLGTVGLCLRGYQQREPLRQRGWALLIGAGVIQVLLRALGAVPMVMLMSGTSASEYGRMALPLGVVSNLGGLVSGLLLLGGLWILQRPAR